MSSVARRVPETEPCVRLGKFVFTATGLLTEGNPTYDEWAAAGQGILVLMKGLEFAVGDWLNYGEAKYGELAAQVVDARDWAPETVRVYRWVAAKVPPQNRMLGDGLKFAHHQAVAGLAPAKQRQWLEAAASTDNEDGKPWTSGRLKAALKSGGEEPATRWWVLVEMRGEEDQRLFLREMEASNRAAKAVTRRGE
jgi:hypothetical protein